MEQDEQVSFLSRYKADEPSQLQLIRSPGLLGCHQRRLEEHIQDREASRGCSYGVDSLEWRLSVSWYVSSKVSPKGRMRYCALSYV